MRKRTRDIVNDLGPEPRVDDLNFVPYRVKKNALLSKKQNSSHLNLKSSLKRNLVIYLLILGIAGMLWMYLQVPINYDKHSEELINMRSPNE